MYLKTFLMKTAQLVGALPQQFMWKSTTKMFCQRDFCSCLFNISSSLLGLITLRAILMSFAILKRAL